MKRLLKYTLFGVLGVVVLAVLLVAGWLGYYNLKAGPPVDPAAYPWPRRATQTEIDQMAKDLLSKMSLEEKIDQKVGQGLSRFLAVRLVRHHFGIGYSGYNARLHIPPLAFSDGPRGVTVAHATSFPVAMARAATWDVGLEREVGDVFGQEARAAGANTFGGICINLLRHPSWGRAQETYGEDPWLLGEMGLAVMQGVQANNVMGCAKHFALNSIEDSRFQVNVQIGERTLREVYLPHFKKLVDHGVASIMSSYNRVRGEYAGQNHYLLTEILRHDWGFRGYVSSDWIYGLRDGLKGLEAGLDIEMPGSEQFGKLPELVREGKADERDIDESVLRILRTKLDYITREDPRAYDRDLIASPEHIDLSRKVAEQSMVLLKNESGVLPLAKEGIKKLALIGRLIEEDNTGDRGSSWVNPPYIVTPLEGFAGYLGDSVELLHCDGSDLNEVRRLSGEADAVVLLAGFRYDDEGEYVNSDGGMPHNEAEMEAPFGMKGGDRYPLGLKDFDIRMIQAAAATNPKVIVALIGGSAITMEEWKNEVPAILMAWYFGMEGANALPRVLFGDVNPSGKLPFTIPTGVDQLPPFDPFAPEVMYGYYHGYTLIDKKDLEPAVRFGYGLSYTSFAYDNIKVLTPEVAPDGEVRVSVDVTNTGRRAGQEIVQLYIGFENSAVDRPVKLLRDFAKIELSPGETQTVHLSVPAKELAWYNPETKAWEVERMQYKALVGPSSDPNELVSAPFEVMD
jgi:beta-glucosidase